MLLPVLVISLLLIFKAIIIVKQKTAVIIQRFGKYIDHKEAGINFIIPFIDQKAGIVNLKVQQLDN